MAKANLEVIFEPATVKANTKNEVSMTLKLSTSDDKALWCECDIYVKYPLSLAYDRELKAARSRLGLVKPDRTIEKKIKLYTMPNNSEGQYLVGVVTYAYGEDGVIEDRQQRKAELDCVA